MPPVEGSFARYALEPCPQSRVHQLVGALVTVPTTHRTNRNSAVTALTGGAARLAPFLAVTLPLVFRWCPGDWHITIACQRHPTHRLGGCGDAAEWRQSWKRKSLISARPTAVSQDRGMSSSVPDLKRKLMRCIRQYNKQAKPVKWKYFDASRRITPDSIVTVH